MGGLKNIVADPSEGSIALGEAIALLHDGMEQAAINVVKFQTMVGDLVRMAGSTADQDVIERAQAIDALAQSIFRLSHAAEAIAAALQTAGAGDAEIVIGRNELANLQQVGQVRDASNGDFDLF
jgi:hypothetical protein